LNLANADLEDLLRHDFDEKAESQKSSKEFRETALTEINAVEARAKDIKSEATQAAEAAATSEAAEAALAVVSSLSKDKTFHDSWKLAKKAISSYMGFVKNLKKLIEQQAAAGDKKEPAKMVSKPGALTLATGYPTTQGAECLGGLRSSLGPPCIHMALYLHLVLNFACSKSCFHTALASEDVSSPMK